MPRWFLFSLIHPTFSVAGFSLGVLLPSGGVWGGIGFLATMLTFLINLPGVFFAQLFYTSSPSEPTGVKYVIFVTMAIFTWLVIIVPLFYLIARIIAKLKAEQGAAANL